MENLDPARFAPTVLNDMMAKEWEYVAHGAVVVERNRWFVATCISLLLAATAVGALTILLPLQRLVPLAVAIDSRSGLVTSVEYSKNVSDLTQKEAVQRSDVAKYVIARESYDPFDLTTNARLVRVMSDGTVWRQYEDEMSQYSDGGKVKRYGAKVRRRVDISTVLPLPGNANTYQVRFVATEDMPGAQLQPVERPYVATLTFRYSDRTLSNEDRILNPLNFRAVSYRQDQEIVNPAASQTKVSAQ